MHATGWALQRRHKETVARDRCLCLPAVLNTWVDRQLAHMAERDNSHAHCSSAGCPHTHGSEAIKFYRTVYSTTVMKKLNKLFHKKPKEGSYTATESTALRGLTHEELCAIIYKYDDEVKRLSTALVQGDTEKELERARQRLKEVEEDLGRVEETQVRKDLKRMEQQNQDLEVLRKAQETEVTRLTFLLESTRTELQETRLRAQDQERLAQDTELTLQHRVLDLEARTLEAQRLAFQNQSLEGEIHNLKDMLQTKQEALEKKTRKLGQLRQQMTAERTERQAETQSWEAKLREAQSQGARGSLELRERLCESQQLGALRWQQLDERGREAEQLRDQLQAWRQTEQALRLQLSQTQVQCQDLASQLHSFACEKDLQTQEVEKLKAALDTAQKKRELARNEVIKLSQRLEQSAKPAPPPADLTLDPRSLTSLRSQLEFVYKRLLAAIKSETGSKTGITLDAACFGEVERRLNELVMQLREGVELSPAEMPIHKAGRTAVSLFACMSAPTERQSTIVIKSRARPNV